MSVYPGAPQPSHQPPTGLIRLHIQGSRWTSSVLVPTVMVNGARVQTTYGENVLPVWAGTNTVAAQAEWMWTYGKAALTVNVAPEQVVDVWYASPAANFLPGAMGFTKQKRPGFVAVYSVLGVILSVAILGVVLAVING